MTPVKAIWVGVGFIKKDKTGAVSAGGTHKGKKKIEDGGGGSDCGSLAV